MTSSLGNNPCENKECNGFASQNLNVAHLATLEARFLYYALPNLKSYNIIHYGWYSHGEGNHTSYLFLQMK